MTHIITEHPYFGAFVLYLLTAIAFPVTLISAEKLVESYAKLDTEKL